MYKMIEKTKIKPQKEIIKEKKRQKYGAVRPIDLEVTPMRPKVNFYDDYSEKRIAIYVRVSTDSADQTSSYEIQQAYYSDYVNSREGWTLYKIFADEGKSGTNIDKRPAFQQMIKEAQEGKFDIIITKNVSRFSRNIEDSVKYTRLMANLKHPVGVYFENERLFTLDDDCESKVAMLSNFAQEESHTKSTSMNSSIDMRFSYGLFLTPPLLGYDNDEDGKLIINEEEAATVRLIFYMYLYGYSTGEIANRLAQLGCITKKGNTDWTSGAVYAQLTNERHYGAVRSRKTWTPNYLNHRARKNRAYSDGSTDRRTFTKHDHHEPIISRDDFIAVQHMIQSAKYGNCSFLPQLKVIAGGTLHGFVSINPHWAAFGAEDYVNASNSASDKKQKSTHTVIAKKGDIDLRRGHLVCAQNFIDANVSSVSFDAHKFRFSSACVRKLPDVEYVELAIHPGMGSLAVRPCENANKHAIRWHARNNDKLYGRDIGCAAFSKTLFALLNWDTDKKYMIRGRLQKHGKESIFMFYAADAEVAYLNHNREQHTLKTIFNYYAVIKSEQKPNRIYISSERFYNPRPSLNPTPESALPSKIDYLSHMTKHNIGGGKKSD